MAARPFWCVWSPGGRMPSANSAMRGSGRKPRGSTCASPQRRLAQGTSFLSYRLYLDAGHTQPLGCDPGNGASGTGIGFEQVLPGYLRIPAGQTPSATGAHVDSVLVTLTF